MMKIMKMLLTALLLFSGMAHAEITTFVGNTIDGTYQDAIAEYRLALSQAGVTVKAESFENETKWGDTRRTPSSDPVLISFVKNKGVTWGREGSYLSTEASVTAHRMWDMRAWTGNVRPILIPRGYDVTVNRANKKLYGFGATITTEGSSPHVTFTLDGYDIVPLTDAEMDLSCCDEVFVGFIKTEGFNTLEVRHSLESTRSNNLRHTFAIDRALLGGPTSVNPDW